MAFLRHGPAAAGLRARDVPLAAHTAGGPATSTCRAPHLGRRGGALRLGPPPCHPRRLRVPQRAQQNRSSSPDRSSGLDLANLYWHFAAADRAETDRQCRGARGAPPGGESSSSSQKLGYRRHYREGEKVKCFHSACRSSVRPLTVGFSCLFLEWRRIFMPSTAALFSSL
eukprot:COSAG06_NODE_2035_length_7776_cov_4.018106_1_plen_170_part_00